jgi:hypothetical protein
MELTEDNSLFYAGALLFSIACIVIGIVLLVGKPEFLGRSRFLVGRRGKMDDYLLAGARLTGIQTLIMGVLLLAGIYLFINLLTIAGLVAVLLAILLPIPFSMYRKRSKRFAAFEVKGKKR